MSDYKPSPDGEPPLSKAKDWTQITIDGQECKRETNIMPQWAGSCWYYLRFVDPNNNKEAWCPKKEKYWLPVDLYVGGVEHANLHLLYARFWHKVLYDLGYVSTKEPFKRVMHPGIILGPNSEKMSKSRGNVINPNDVIKEWGADSLRLYELFLGPFDQAKPWQTSGISGVNRFLKKAWRLAIAEDGSLSAKITDATESKETEKQLHKTIHKVEKDTEALHFNTAISAMMEFVNFCNKQEKISRSTLERFIVTLAPYAPHIAEELWERLGHTGSLTETHWPSYDPKMLTDDEATLCVMVNGKARGTLKASKTAGEAEVTELAKQQENIQKHIDGKAFKKVIYVPGKIINFVV